MPVAAKSLKQRTQDILQKIRTGKLKAPQTIVFGKGKLDELGQLVFPLAKGGKALLLTGARSARQSGLFDQLQALLQGYTAGVIPAPAVNREPTVAMVDAAAALARDQKPKIIISVGGGSVMDCGKAVAALATNEGSVEEYLEGVGTRTQLAAPPLPHIVIPTVPGTGAEMTRNAVITSPEKHYKRSMRFDSMIPTIALLDPLLTVGVPPHITAAGGMDTITQLIEPCITAKRRPETTQLALEGLRLAAHAVSASYEDPNNLSAREEMLLVSMLSGVCLANSGLAMAHGIAAALGALYDVPHGLACGILLPHTLRYNRDACADELAQALAAFLNEGKSSPSSIGDGLAALEGLNRWLHIPPDLRYLNLREKDLVLLAEASGGTSMAGNPIPMTPDKTLEFLRKIT
ncbi:MAG: iron-containing alcohol dehydrogenase [Verrucomicrobiota bacterium]